MNETVLLYNFQQTQNGEAIIRILNQLNVKVKNITSDEITCPIGYLLGVDGYIAADEKPKVVIEDEMMIIHNFNDKQIDLMLQIFKEANIPYIPLKAVVTPTNIDWAFQTLLEHVKEEYQQIIKMKK